MFINFQCLHALFAENEANVTAPHTEWMLVFNV